MRCWLPSEAVQTSSEKITKRCQIAGSWGPILNWPKLYDRETFRPVKRLFGEMREPLEQRLVETKYRGHNTIQLRPQKVSSTEHLQKRRAQSPQNSDLYGTERLFMK